MSWNESARSMCTLYCIKDISEFEANNKTRKVITSTYYISTFTTFNIFGKKNIMIEFPYPVTGKNFKENV